MSRTFTRPTSALVALVVGLTMSLALSTSSDAAGSGPAAGSAAGSAASTSASRVAHNHLGSLRSHITGTTSQGQRVTGTFVPLHVIRRDGAVRVRGLIQGVVHHANGSTATFAALRTLRVRSLNGMPVTSARSGVAAAASCAILHLTLGPLDLNLLGLKVHLNTVVLNIDAAPGPGNLLGNLLCAVAGLLDGGLQGQLATVTGLLNRILALLNLSI